MRGSRKKLVFGFLVSGSVLAVSSAAFACTIWVGQFTVSRDINGNGTTYDPSNPSANPYEQVRTYGLGTGMNHCAMGGAVKVHMGNASHSGSNVTLTYGPLPTPRPTTCATADGREPHHNTYTITYLNTGFGEFLGGNSGNWAVDGGDVYREYKFDCMAVGGHQSRWNDTQELSYSGGTVSMAVGIDKKPSSINSGNEITDLPGTESAICLQEKAGSYTGTPDGAQAPVIVI